MKHFTLSNILKILLVFLAVAAALKILFVGYDFDEQYALAMSYRLLKGDIPVLDMWEPHQTSGFLAALFMSPYVAVTGSTTGIVLYLRICGLFVHSITALLFYRQADFLLKEHTPMPSGFRRDICLLITCIYFFSLPKLMFFPDFSNMQVWFLLLMILCLSHYYTRIILGRQVFPGWLAGAGFCLSLEVLSYPSSLLLFPVCLCYIFHRRRQPKRENTDFSPKRCSPAWELAAFCLPCIILALLFIGFLLTKMPLPELIALLPFAVSDGSHSFTLTEKLVVNGKSLLEIVCFFAVYGTVAFLITFFRRRLSAPIPERMPSGQKKDKPLSVWTCTLLVVTLSGQLLMWIFGDHYPNYPLVEYFFVPALALLLIRPGNEPEKQVSFLFILLPLTAFAGIVFMTNHPLLVSAPFLGICTAGSLLYIFLHLKKQLPLLRGVLIFWAAVLLFGKCYLIRTTGGVHYTIFDQVSVLREGPAAYMIADTETVRQYRDTLSLVEENLPDGAKVFYIGTANGIYLMGDMEFCTPSTISSPTFDEKVEAYFSLHPEKFPEYIICDLPLSGLNGYLFLSDYLQKYCAPDPVAENDYLAIYRTDDFSLSHYARY